MRSHGQEIGAPAATVSGFLASRRGFLLAATGITVAGLLLRLHRIGEPELWLDEVVSFQAATTPDFLGLLVAEGNAPLYYLLLRGWVVVAGTSEAGLRLLSALAGTLLVPAVTWVGRGLFGRGIGLWSGVLAALAPLHVYYSQEARTYAVTACLITAMYGALWRALETDRWRWWAITAAWATAAMLAHYLAALVIVAATPFALAWGTWRQRRRYVLTMAAGGLVIVAWLAISTPHAGPRAAAAFSATWLLDAWQSTPPWLAVPTSLELLGLGSQARRVPIWLRRFQALEFPAWARWTVLATLGLLGVWAAIPWRERRLGIGEIRRKVGYLFGLLLIPLLLLWGISYVKPIYLAGRYDLVAFPAFTLLLGLALGKLWGSGRGGPWLAGAAATVLVVGLGLKLGLYYLAPSDRVPSSRATATVLSDAVEPDDVVVFSGHRGLLVLYYLGRLGYRWDGDRCASRDGVRHFTCAIFPRHPSPAAEEADTRRFLAEATARRTTVWLVPGSYLAGAEVTLVLDSDVRLVVALRLGGLEATVANSRLGIIRMRVP